MELSGDLGVPKAPWWVDPLPEPMDHEVRHYRVRASSNKGQGVAELEHRYEGWLVARIWD
jgi:hypothetical protein